MFWVFTSRSNLIDESYVEDRTEVLFSGQWKACFHSGCLIFEVRRGYPLGGKLFSEKKNIC